MSFEIYTEIQILATPEKIWQQLTNLQDYPLWNPFIQKMEGVLEKGQKIKVEIHPPNKGKMAFTPEIICLENHKKLIWQGKFIFKGLFDGQHHFEIKDNQNGSSTFIQKEKFSGILVSLFQKTLQNNTKLGFEQMNDILKKRAEAIE